MLSSDFTLLEKEKGKWEKRTKICEKRTKKKNINMI
jgi:hypothetical protein